MRNPDTEAYTERVSIFAPGCHSRYAGPHEVPAYTFARTAWSILRRHHDGDMLRRVPVDMVRLLLSKHAAIYRNDTPIPPTRDHARLVLAYGAMEADAAKEGGCYR